MRPSAQFLVLVLLAAGCGSVDDATDSVVSDAEQRVIVERQDQLLDRLTLEPYVAERDNLDRSDNHDQYFRPVGILRLSSDVVLGMTASLDLSREGRILIADRNAVYLFAPDGRLLRRLDPTTCNPGYEFMPYSAGFALDGTILVRNVMRPNIIEFDADGLCVRIRDIPLGGPGGVTPGAGGMLYALKYRPDSHEILEFDSTGVSTIILSGTGFSRYNSRMGGLTPGLVMMSHGELLFMQRQDPLVTLIDPSTGAVRKIGSIPDDYRPVTEDLKPGLQGTEAIFEDIQRISEGKSVTIGIDQVAENIVAVTYRNSWEDSQVSEKSTGLQLVHTSGAVINSEPIHFRFYLSGRMAGRDGVVIREGSRFDEPELTMDDNRPLIVYRLAL